MRRIVSLWLPQFPVERLIRDTPDVPTNQPLVLVAAGARGLRLAACSPAALACGLRPGERLADARARVPHLAARRHEPESDAAMLLKLVRWSERWSPFIAPDPPDGLILDVTGIPHLFGGEAALLADMAARFRRLGFTATPALAGTPAAARALARFGPPVPSSCQRRLASNRDTPAVPTVLLDPSLRWGDGNSGESAGFSEAPSLSLSPSPFPIVAPGAEASALAALPVEALGLDGEICGALRRLGLKRIGQLYELPRASLARRFRDAAGPLMAKLDQALGRVETPITPLGPRPVFTVRRVLVEPLSSAQGVAGFIDHLAQDFCARLEKQGRGALRIAVKLYRMDGSRAVISLGLVQGCHDPRHLARLIAPKLEGLDFGYGIEAGTMEAVETAAVAPAQNDFIAGRAQAAPLAELADRILNRFERLTLARLEAAESHLPERAERMAQPLPPTPILSPRRGGGLSRPRSSPSPLVGEGRGGGPRPVVLFDRPEPVEAMAAVPDGPPLRFTWRRVARHVARAEGPERIAPEWWRGGASAPARTRDYYVIEDSAGRRYWLFREGLYGEEARPAWFIHGLFA